MSGSPAELLERAATLIEQRAATAAAGRYDWSDVVGFIVDDYTDDDLEAAHDYVKLVSPAVAPPLVEWLRDTVVQYIDEHGMRSVPPDVLDAVWSRHPAVRLARLIVGEEEG